MRQIMGEWSTPKYSVIKEFFEEDPSQILILLIDPIFWYDNRTKLYEWCCKNNLEYKMTNEFLVVRDEKTLVQFALKWA